MMLKNRSLPWLVISVFLLMAFTASIAYDGALARLEPLTASSMRNIDGQAGLNFQLKDLRLLSGSGHEFVYSPNESTNNELILKNVSIRETPNNSESEYSLGHDNGRVTTGTFNDPITLNIRSGAYATTDEYLRLELPENDASMEPNNVRIGALKLEDYNHNAWHEYDLGRLEIRDADYTGGTKLELAGKQDGGLMLGLGIKLDGILQLDTPWGDGLLLNRVLAGSNCVDDSGGTCSDDDSNSSTWNFDGGLTWADLSTNRPLALDIIGDCCDASERALFVEFNPDRVNPEAGQFAVQQATMNYGDYGEIWTEEVRVVNVRLRAPVNVTSDLTGYSCNGNHSGC